MGLLDGDLARAIHQGFRGRLLGGVIRRDAAPENVTLDAYGDPETTAPVVIPIEGFDEAYSAFSRAQAGIPDTDVRVNILGYPLGDFRPSEGDLIRLDRKDASGNTTSRWFQVRRSSVDSAGALWTCQSFETEAPSGG